MSTAPVSPVEYAAAWAADFGALAPAQIYIGSGGKRARSARPRSVRRGYQLQRPLSFHRHGYPAVVVSADFFANRSAEPGRDRIPNYHCVADKVINAAEAADIVCALAHAVRELAT